MSNPGESPSLSGGESPLLAGGSLSGGESPPPLTGDGETPPPLSCGGESPNPNPCPPLAGGIEGSPLAIIFQGTENGSVLPTDPQPGSTGTTSLPLPHLPEFVDVPNSCIDEDAVKPEVEPKLAITPGPPASFLNHNPPMTSSAEEGHNTSAAPVDILPIALGEVALLLPPATEEDLESVLVAQKKAIRIAALKEQWHINNATLAEHEANIARARARAEAAMRAATIPLSSEDDILASVSWVDSLPDGLSHSLTTGASGSLPVQAPSIPPPLLSIPRFPSASTGREWEGRHQPDSAPSISSSPMGVGLLRGFFVAVVSMGASIPMRSLPNLMVQRLKGFVPKMRDTLSFDKDYRSLILLACTVTLFLISFFRYNRTFFNPELGIVSKAISENSNTVKRECAIVLFGALGSLQAANRYAHAQMHDVRVPELTRPSLLKNVVDFNKNTWSFDFFLHSWNASAKEELVQLYQPLAHATGEAFLHGRHVHLMYPNPGRMEASQELALKTMWDYVETHRGGKVYDRILLVRYDVLFLSPFNVSKLVRDDAIYVTNWCKALGKPNVTSDGRDCRTLVPSYFENVGLSDFYFAASDQVMRRMFTKLLSDFEGGVFKTTSLGMNHGLFLARVWSLGLTLSHYYYHQMDIEIYRSYVCNPFHAWCSEYGQTWLDRGEDVTTDGFVSGCNLRSSFCSCGSEREHPESCELGAFFH